MALITRVEWSGTHKFLIFPSLLLCFARNGSLFFGIPRYMDTQQLLIGFGGWLKCRVKLEMDAAILLWQKYNVIFQS